MAVFVRRSILILFPFLDLGDGDSKSQRCSKLRHGKVEVHPLFAKVLAKGLGACWIVSQLLKMERCCSVNMVNGAVARSQQAQCRQR